MTCPTCSNSSTLPSLNVRGVPRGFSNLTTGQGLHGGLAEEGESGRDIGVLDPLLLVAGQGFPAERPVDVRDQDPFVKDVPAVGIPEGSEIRNALRC
jgi:hypothetical protein